MARTQTVVKTNKQMTAHQDFDEKQAAVLDDPLLIEALHRLVDEFQPERIYLFGSRARGDATPESDYDLMVIVDERVGPPFHMERRAYAALWTVPFAKDVVILSTERFEWLRSAAASLAATVLREGRLLYAR